MTRRSGAGRPREKRADLGSTLCTSSSCCSSSCPRRSRWWTTSSGSATFPVEGTARSIPSRRCGARRSSLLRGEQSSKVSEIPHLLRKYKGEGAQAVEEAQRQVRAQGGAGVRGEPRLLDDHHRTRAEFPSPRVLREPRTPSRVPTLPRAAVPIPARGLGRMATRISRRANRPCHRSDGRVWPSKGATPRPNITARSRPLRPSERSTSLARREHRTLRRRWTARPWRPRRNRRRPPPPSWRAS